MHPCTHTPIHPYTYIHIHTHTLRPYTMHAYTHAAKHPYTHTPIHPCTLTPIYTHTLHPYTMHPYTHVHSIHPYTHSHMHPYNRTPIHAHQAKRKGQVSVTLQKKVGCMYVCARVYCTHTPMHLHIYTHTHIHRHAPKHIYTHTPIHPNQNGRWLVNLDTMERRFGASFGTPSYLQPEP